MKSMQEYLFTFQFQRPPLYVFHKSYPIMFLHMLHLMVHMVMIPCWRTVFSLNFGRYEWNSESNLSSRLVS